MIIQCLSVLKHRLLLLQGLLCKWVPVGVTDEGKTHKVTLKRRVAVLFPSALLTEKQSMTLCFIDLLSFNQWRDDGRKYS